MLLILRLEIVSAGIFTNENPENITAGLKPRVFFAGDCAILAPRRSVQCLRIFTVEVQQ